MTTLAGDVWHSWPVYCARDALRRAWAGLPGPWWVKILLIAACQLIPGGFDEWALLAGTAAWRKYRTRRQGIALGGSK